MHIINSYQFIFVVISLILLTRDCVQAYVSPANYEFNHKKGDPDSNFLLFGRTMYEGSDIKITVQCGSTSNSSRFSIKWLLRQTPCFNELKEFDKSLESDETHLDYERVTYIESNARHLCDGQPKDFYLLNVGRVTTVNVSKSKTPDPIIRRRRDVNDTEPETVPTNSSTVPTNPSTALTGPIDGEAGSISSETVVTTPNVDKGESDNSKTTATTPATTVKKPNQVWKTGAFLMKVELTSEPDDFQYLRIDIDIQKGDSYLSPMDFPLYVFYAVMCAVYAVYTVGWLLVSCYYRSDMLRVQYWIGLVILLGLVEKAFFLREYTTVNSSGKSVMGGVLLAEIMSALKRALARVLVVIVSLGFGIVKPRLGTSLYKVLGLGGLYFILACVEAYIRVESTEKDYGNTDLIILIPLVVVETIFVYWIFISITQTMRTLRVRRNAAKLSLYRHFFYTLVFCLLAAIVFAIWVIKEYRFKKCIKDWNEIWLQDAYWHILFGVILLVIIVLWRPSQNNQRYAFSPLLDEMDDDEEEEEFTKSGAMETVKSRSKSPGRNRSRSRNRSMEQDLKWVEDNIPASLADSVLPMLDSEDEARETRKEMAKMD